MKMAWQSTVVPVVMCAVLIAPLWTRSAGAQERTETERVDRTVPLQPGGEVRLKNFSGKITITGVNRGDVSIHAVRRAPRERLDHIRLDIEESGSRVSIDANKKDSSWSDHQKNNVVDTEFVIEVPQRTALDVHAFSSDMHITDVGGHQKLYTFSGTIRLIAANGPVEAETFSGNIDADLSRAAAAPSVDMKTFSGDIDLKLAAEATGRVDFDTFSGGLKSDVALTLRGASRRRVTGNLGGGVSSSNDLHFKTFSGDVRISK
jgi:hypothetical protein